MTQKKLRKNEKSECNNGISISRCVHYSLINGYIIVYIIVYIICLDYLFRLLI